MTISTDTLKDTDLSKIREQFPSVTKLAYFDVAARALLPQDTRDAVDNYLDTLMEKGGDKAEMFRVVESARSRFATLIGADPDEIAITKNVSEGINIIATAYPWQAGDKAIICADREHPNNIYIWRHLAQRRRGAGAHALRDGSSRLSQELRASPVKAGQTLGAHRGRFR